MSIDALDTGDVAPDRGVYATKRQSCGCFGVPDGQHIPPCERCTTPEARRCSACEIRTASDPDGACGRCGLPK